MRDRKGGGGVKSGRRMEGSPLRGLVRGEGRWRNRVLESKSVVPLSSHLKDTEEVKKKIT